MRNSKGFSVVEGLLILVIVGLLGGVGWYVYNANNKARDTYSNAANSDVPKYTLVKSFAECKAAAGSKVDKNAYPETCTTKNQKKFDNPDQPKYLVIKELGIQVKLNKITSDAYYTLGDSLKKWVSLSTHSLDKYPNCKNVAAVGYLTKDQNDPVYGTYKDYPNAPYVNGRYYFMVGSQSNCTMGQGTEQDMQLANDVRAAFVDTEPTLVKE